MSQNWPVTADLYSPANPSLICGHWDIPGGPSSTRAWPQKVFKWGWEDLARSVKNNAFLIEAHFDSIPHSKRNFNLCYLLRLVSPSLNPRDANFFPAEANLRAKRWAIITKQDRVGVKVDRVSDNKKSSVRSNNDVMNVTLRGESDWSVAVCGPGYREGLGMHNNCIPAYR